MVTVASQPEDLLPLLRPPVDQEAPPAPSGHTPGSVRALVAVEAERRLPDYYRPSFVWWFERRAECALVGSVLALSILIGLAAVRLGG